MTICLWDKEKLYCDSLVSGAYYYTVQKFRIINPNCLAFGSGHFTNLSIVYDWLEDPKSNTLDKIVKENDDDRFSAAVITRVDDDFKVQVINSQKHLVSVPNQLMVYGCGYAYAEGALKAGASSLRAVQIACELDVSCDVPIIEVGWDKEKGFSVIKEYGKTKFD